MDRTEFLSEMEKRGCFNAGNLFCGTYQGRPFSVRFIRGQAGKKTEFGITLHFDKRVDTAFTVGLKKVVKPYMKIRFLSATDIVTANVIINGKQNFSEMFDFLLQAIDEQAKMLNYIEPTVCPVCKQGGCDTYAYYKSTYVPTHAACLQQDAANKVAKAQHNELNGNYLTGIIGALIGGLIGMLPNVLSIVYGEVIYSLLCALVPLCAYYGYKLFKGKMNRAAMAVTICVSVVIAPVMDYVSTMLYGYKEYKMILPVSQYIAILQDDFSILFESVGQNLLFIGLGVVCVYGLIKRGNQDVYLDADTTIKSARSIEGNN